MMTRELARMACGAALLALGCGGEREAPRPEAAVATGPTVLAVEERGPVFEWASGAVASARQTVVASRVLAAIVEIPVRAGAEVRMGDVVAVLDARDLAAREGEAQQALTAARAELGLADREAARIAQLVGEGVATVQERDRSAAALRVARAEFERAQESLAAARIAKSYTELRAPVSGRVIERLAEPGETATPGRPLLRIYDPGVLRAEAPVRESLAVKLALGDTLALEVQSLALRVDGVVDEIVPYAEPGARTLLVKVRLPADPRLYAGLFVRIAIPAGERTRVLVPEAAVEREGQLESVRIAGASGAAELRAITTGERMPDGRVEVLSGLRAGELVVLPSGPAASAGMQRLSEPQ